MNHFVHCCSFSTSNKITSKGCQSASQTCDFDAKKCKCKPLSQTPPQWGGDTPSPHLTPLGAFDFNLFHSEILHTLLSTMTSSVLLTTKISLLVFLDLMQLLILLIIRFQYLFLISGLPLRSLFSIRDSSTDFRINLSARSLPNNYGFITLSAEPFRRASQQEAQLSRRDYAMLRVVEYIRCHRPVYSDATQLNLTSS